MAVNDAMDDGDIASRDLEDTDIADLDGLRGVAQEEDVASCECWLHTLTGNKSNDLGRQRLESVNSGVTWPWLVGQGGWVDSQGEMGS